ncbi:GNAT family N-acetyltransferase [Aurantiacibacter rhizosphaerae]|uniref:GNAT family N-acetyltransferase n=1 Tax=Aurantiacibacter rhizosphaerae TaxID=2691582 RepID=A0A844XC41_9SPHN|nr:GNAT family N-acetyltransferase [Aurantiacibacter rhizosphaerae]MWV27204.1 GNAT family N-acetyltransferase [Aurantiacibacter rhizosphaerae]
MTPSDWSVRLAHPEDAEAFAEVEGDALRSLRDAPSLAEHTLPPPRSADEYRAIIAQRQSLSVLSEERILGFAAARPAGRALHLHQISVARAFQRNGIGATLLRALQIDARNAGFAAITLHTFRAIAWNAPFFAGHGFEEVADLSAHPRLAAGQDAAVREGLPEDMRCAMICQIDR